MNFLPSRSFMVTVIGIAALGAVTYFVTDYLVNRPIKRDKEKAIKAESEISRMVVTGLSKLQTQDTDSDTIPDWEEALWGTDHTKKDSDGDNIDDLSEIKILKMQARSSTDSTVAPKALNSTERFSRDLFSAVLVLDQTKQLNTESKERLSEQVALSIVQNTRPPQFSSLDVAVVADTPEARSKYLQNVTSILTEANINANDPKRILESIMMGVPSDAIAMDNLERIKSALTRLVRVPTPSVLLTTHLNLVNAVSAYHYHFYNMTLTAKDPLPAMGSVMQIEGALNDFSVAVKAVYSVGQ